MNVIHKSKAVVLALVAMLVAMVAPVSAMAAELTPTGPDFSGILDGIDASTIVTGIVAGAAILGLVGFARWGAKKVAKLFG